MARQVQLLDINGQHVDSRELLVGEALEAPSPFAPGTHTGQPLLWNGTTYAPADAIRAASVRSVADTDGLVLQGHDARIGINEADDNAIIVDFTGMTFRHLIGNEVSLYLSAASTQLSPSPGVVPIGGAVQTLRTVSGPMVGFYDASPQLQPTITGSRGGNAALASLLTELATLGLIVDGTSA